MVIFYSKGSINMTDNELYGLLTLRSEIGFYLWFARVFLRKRQKRERYSFFRNNQKFSRSAKILIRYSVLWVAINDIMQVTQPTGGFQCGLSLIWWDWRQADLENFENTVYRALKHMVENFIAKNCGIFIWVFLWKWITVCSGITCAHFDNLKMRNNTLITTARFYTVCETRFWKF